MKNRLFLLLFIIVLIAALKVNAQNNIFPTSGNVGIGTEIPTSKLSINGLGGTNIDLSTTGRLAITGSNSAGIWFSNGSSNNYSFIGSQSGNILRLFHNGSNRIQISSTGQVSMIQGTSNTSFTNADGGLAIKKVDNSPYISWHKSDGGRLGYIQYTTTYMRLRSESASIMHLGVGADHINVLSSGNVGIGTTTPTQKLEVNGTIRAKEVKVEANNWPDYVFFADYELMSLEKTAEFIQVHHHLPGIPAANEIQENGLALGEMNKKLLEKIEELTIHLIQLNDQNASLQTRIEQLEKSVNKD